MRLYSKLAVILHNSCTNTACVDVWLGCFHRTQKHVVYELMFISVHLCTQICDHSGDLSPRTAFPLTLLTNKNKQEGKSCIVGGHVLDNNPIVIH